ncbi:MULTISPECIES: transcriptional regulator NrdR [Fluviispira]|uniref:Transcriptional repressor NrdR n=1 Tax=Fluviispira sanaruensis TaxID=2493639 RepID=A0A4P2VIG9_FLUSA|nr:MULTISPECIES: transcriptional regulator NrdR [Fluviispira]BBH52208.1 transcriptional regulator NrdR [Fluviispira sanaruensis]
MKCRQCQNPESKVLESRESRDGRTVRRRRECIKCGYRFTTFERSEEQPLYIIKRDGTRELFNREKLLKSMSIACQKRSVSSKSLDAISDWVECACHSSDDEVTSQKIGELVLEALLKLDPVAYVRFASVYRAFSSPEDFVLELKQLTEKAQNKTDFSLDLHKDSESIHS